jgi:DUF4097 and DUF4098 domain-containing protein YvlB
MPRLAVLLTLALAAPAVATAREEAVRRVDKTLAVSPGRSVRLSHEHGDVTVRGGTGTDVSIHARIWASADSRAVAEGYAARVGVLVREEADGVSIRTDCPDPDPGRPDLSFSVDYEIILPESAPLSIDARFGDVSVSGLGAAVEVTNSHGRIGLSDSRGDARLQNEFGIVEAERVGGALTVTNTNAPVRVTDVGGTLTVSSRFGDVTVRQARRAATLTASNARIEVTGAGGPLSITDAFSLVLVSAVAGDVTVDNRNGRVEARDVRGALTTKSSHGEITFSDVGGRVTVTSEEGRVSGAGLRGPTRVGNSGGAVSLRDVQGDVVVQNAGGPVSVQEVRGAVEVKNRRGDVEVESVQGRASVENAHAATLVHDVTRGVAVQASHGRIEVRRVGADAKVLGGNGDVSIADVAGSAFVRTSHGLVQATGVGPLTVDSEDSAVRASVVRGAAVVRTTSASVVLSDVDGSVDVQDRGGAVELSGFTPSGPQGCRRVSLSTSFAPIKLTLPDGVGLDVTAHASLGRIRSPLLCAPAGEAGSFVGPLGGGGCAVTLANTNGDIEIVPGGATARR